MAGTRSWVTQKNSTRRHQMLRTRRRWQGQVGRETCMLERSRAWIYWSIFLVLRLLEWRELCFHGQVYSQGVRSWGHYDLLHWGHYGHHIVHCFHRWDCEFLPVYQYIRFFLMKRGFSTCMIFWYFSSMFMQTLYVIIYSHWQIQDFLDQGCPQMW